MTRKIYPISLTILTLALMGGATAVKSAPSPGTAHKGPVIFEAAQLDEVPTNILPSAPEYPESLKNEGVFGQVLIDFMVDTRGKVHFAKVLSATDPRLGRLSVAAVMTWLFKPGKKGGVAVNTHMQVPMLFSLGAAAKAPRFPAAAGQDLSPHDTTVPLVAVSELRILPKPIYSEPPEFPQGLKAKKKSAEVVVDFIVDENGLTRNLRVASTTDPRFSSAALASIAHWIFTPGLTKDGRVARVETMLPVRFDRVKPTAAKARK